MTSVAKLHGKTRRPFQFKPIVFAVLVFLISLAIATQSQERIISSTVTVCTGLFIAFAIWRNTKPRDFWVLHVETAAASSNLLASRDELLIDDAVTKITEAMESDVNFHTSLTINDSNIVSADTIANSPIGQTR